LLRGGLGHQWKAEFPRVRARGHHLCYRLERSRFLSRCSGSIRFANDGEFIPVKDLWIDREADRPEDVVARERVAPRPYPSEPGGVEAGNLGVGPTLLR
jgi:hypothetical protein